MDEPKLNRYAVIGNPVSHSMSPYIHQVFAEQFGIDLSYTKILSEIENFQQVVDDFFAMGGCGLNVTTPFKSLAAKYVTHRSSIAEACCSVNTIFINDVGEPCGESTDGQGWLSDIRRLQIMLPEKNILIIGAGGAARILVARLLTENIQALHVCNRTADRAQVMQKESHQNNMTASGLDDIPRIKWDLVINTLPVGWQGNYPVISALITETTIAYDLNYGQGAQSFKHWFISAGGQQKLFYDGWGMLVEQAAASFNLWWKLKPATAELIKSNKL